MRLSSQVQKLITEEVTQVNNIFDVKIRKMTSSCVGSVMYISSVDVNAGDTSFFESDNMMLYEGDTKCLSFWFMFETGLEEEDQSLESLTIYTHDTEDHVVTAWKMTQSHDFWNEGQVALTRGGDLQIKFEVVHGSGHVPGYAAIDDIRIVTFGANEEVVCDNLPPLDVTTKTPCSEPQITCEDGSCLDPSKRCNFVSECPNDSSDEEGCPDMFLFNDCSDLTDCHWTEMVGENMEWIVATTEMTGARGPDVNWQNSTSGKFLYVKPKTGDVKQGSASIQSPMYQDSNTDCALVFNIYISGANNPTVLPVLELVQHDCDHCITFLDKLDNDVIVEGSWSEVKIGLGRHTDIFTAGFLFSYHSEDTAFDAGVAIDDVRFFGCALPPVQESCSDEEFHCTLNKGCIPLTDKCDLADNCGDLSDEFLECDNFTQINFEDPDEPYGFFSHISETAQFEWKVGNGTTSQEGTGPPFDHTHFNPLGHYLFIDSKQQNANDRALLSSPILEADEQYPDGCRIRLFYHMHGLHVGNLTFYKE